MVSWVRPPWWGTGSGMSITAAAAGGHTIAWSAGAFSILASGTNAPAWTRLFPLVLAQVHTCALKTMGHGHATCTRGFSPVRAPTVSASRTAEMLGTPGDMVLLWL